MPGVLFPDAAAVVVDYLRAELAARDDNAELGNRVVNPRPPRYVLARRLGGVTQTVVSDAALIGVEAWATLAEDAQDLAQLCRALLHAMQGTAQAGVAVYKVEDVGGLADLPDPLSSDPRYVFNVRVHLRGSSL